MDPNGVNKRGVRCKVSCGRQGLEQAIRKGAGQIVGFMYRYGAESLHLAIFGSRRGKSKDDRSIRR